MAGLSNPPTVEIVEHPIRFLRFRYEPEGRPGLLVGASSTPDNKTYPYISIKGHTCEVLVTVSCVTKDKPYRPHPNKLSGSNCNNGVFRMVVSPETTFVKFTNLGIYRMRRRDIEDSLRLRREMMVDPFRTGFGHAEQPSSLDVTAVRLCFQVLSKDQIGNFTVPLTSIVSEPICTKRVFSELVIVKLSQYDSPVDGGEEEIILLCNKVIKDDIQIRFYEERDGKVVWEGFGDFTPSKIFKQVSISFKPPCYKTLNVTQPVQVFIQLRRPSDGETSKPVPFQLLPIESGTHQLSHNGQVYDSLNLAYTPIQPLLPQQEYTMDSTSSVPPHVLPSTS